MNEKIKKAGVLGLCPGIVLFVVTAWVYFWCLNTCIPLCRKLPYMIKSFVSPLNAQRVRFSYDPESSDYFSVLAGCDKLLAPGIKLSIILPKEPENRFFFLREKGRYFLYPRNYGVNDETSAYLLVYGVKNYAIPAGYHMKHVFAAGKFLIEKTNAINSRS